MAPEPRRSGDHERRRGAGAAQQRTVAPEREAYGGAHRGLDAARSSTARDPGDVPRRQRRAGRWAVSLDDADVVATDGPAQALVIPEAGQPGVFDGAASIDHPKPVEALPGDRLLADAVRAAARAGQTHLIDRTIVRGRATASRRERRAGSVDAVERLLAPRVRAVAATRLQPKAGAMDAPQADRASRRDRRGARRPLRPQRNATTVRPAPPTLRAERATGAWPADGGQRDANGYR